MRLKELIEFIENNKLSYNAYLIIEGERLVNSREHIKKYLNLDREIYKSDYCLLMSDLVNCPDFEIPYKHVAYYLPNGYYKNELPIYEFYNDKVRYENLKINSRF